MTFDGRKLTTLFMFALFAGACLLALDLPTKAAFMPLLIGIPGALLCAAQFVVDWRTEARGQERASDKRDDETDENGQSELEAFVWLGLFTIVLLAFGFVVGGPIAVGIFVRFSSRESWPNALFAAAGTFAVLYGVFAWMLGLSLFEGFVLEKLLG
ncbi:MAG TPA: tripartite tricarboxylate transporter TctB family protein [Afifellaceae bacterium]|nr:tripartite tricarboxylate transporter TctB family protein [Afifellaceae bacterium]